jgi:hypothetical protein
MKYVVNHGMSDLDQVRAVIGKAYEAYRKRLADYDPNIEWRDPNNAVVSFKVMRKTIDARFRVDDEQIRVEGDIPFIFRPFQGKIERVVGEEVEKWLAKAKAGEI